jgi:hypothetical protein
MPVAHKLARLLPRVRESHAVHDVIESRFQNLEEIVTRDAAATLRFDEVLVKLALHDAVEPAYLLLLTKLKSEL